MNHTSSLTSRDLGQGFIPQQDEVKVALTAHEHYVVKRTISLRLQAIADEYARNVHRDAYVESSEQVLGKRALLELAEVLDKF